MAVIRPANIAVQVQWGLVGAGTLERAYMAHQPQARQIVAGILAGALLHFPSTVLAAELTARDVTGLLYRHDPANPAPPDLSGRDLSSLDLSEMDFKRARLTVADLFGVDLTNSRLAGVDLTGARLDRSVITRTNFSGAKLSGVSMMRPTLFTTLQSDRREAPNFSGADLSNSRLTGNFDTTSFREADLSGMKFGPHEPRADISFYPRNFCRGCDFTGSKLRGADLYDASFVSARFEGADLSGANLSRTDLSSADLSSADLTGADLSGANLDGTILVGVKGMDQVKGLSLAVNAERAVR